MIRSAPAIDASPPSMARYLTGTPAQKRIKQSSAASIMAVPKSGCSTIRRQSGTTKIRWGTTPTAKRLTASCSFLARECARMMIMASLANSAGWKEKGPHRSHRMAPPTLVPMPGTKSSASSAMLASHSG